MVMTGLVWTSGENCLRNTMQDCNNALNKHALVQEGRPPMAMEERYPGGGRQHVRLAPLNERKREVKWCKAKGSVPTYGERQWRWGTERGAYDSVTEA